MMQRIIYLVTLLLCIWLAAACQAEPAVTPPPATLVAAGAAESTATELPSAELPLTAVQAAPTATLAQPATGALTVTVQATAQATVQPAATATPEPVTCTPTQPDMLGPFYTPGAPVRDAVGSGYVLSGVVRSAEGCAPLANAQIEFWMAGPDGEYTDAYRATLLTDADGRYRFESHFPPPYAGRPSHHHLRVSAPGFQPLVTQHYPAAGQTEATFDLVLLPLGTPAQ